MDISAERDVATQLATAIHNLSAMVASGEECQQVCAAAAECAATMLPGARSIVFEVDAQRRLATINSKANAAFLNNGQQVTLADDSVLARALTQLHSVQRETCSDSNPLCPSIAEFPCESNELLLAKAIPRDDTPTMVLAILCAPDIAELAEGVLLAFSEVLVTLSAGRRVTLMHNASLAEIARAKEEWERTVDLLPEVVCLVDQDDVIVRANRTLERWRLGDVRKVRGINVHDLFHPDCKLEPCALRDGVSVSLAAQAEGGYLQSAVTDPVLGRTLIVHTRLMTDLPADPPQKTYPCAVVVVSDVSALLEAQTKLANLNRDLENRVSVRTQELQTSIRELADEVARRREVERELQGSRDELGNLSQQLLRAQEDERHRLSRELHDSLGQSLGAIKYSLERVAALHEGDPQAVSSHEVAAIIERIGETIRETRAIAIALRPPVLDELGTASAIRTLCQNLGETYAEIAFHIEIEVENSDIPAELSTPVFRIVQEALNNVVKHSGASAVLIALRIEGKRLLLEILDDGVGFDTAIADTGSFERLGKVGRIGMRERAASSKGVLELWSRPGEGTKVSAEWRLGEQA